MHSIRLDKLLHPPKNPSYKLPQQNGPKLFGEECKPQPMKLGSVSAQVKASCKYPRNPDLRKVKYFKCG